MGKFLLKNCDIANFDTLKTERNDILLVDDRIAKIAPHIDSDGTETVIDANGKLALPAFVDCHSHAAQSFLKGWMDDYPITDWLVRLFTIEDMMDEEDVYYATMLTCLQAMRFGTTTINEMAGYEIADASIQAFLDAGMRVTYGSGNHSDVAENEKTPIKTIDQCLRETDELYSKYHGKDGLVSISAAPAGLPAGTKELFQALKAYCREKDLTFHCHLAEGKKETIVVNNREGMWEGECLYEFGILDERTMMAHSIWLEDYELDLIKKAGANPIHCPCTNMKISDGVPKIHQMLERGINVTIGTDGEASSSNRDMIREARAGAYLQKGVTLVPTAMDLGTTYKMMTVNGARALGHKDLGEIKEGNKADLILVETRGDVTLTNQNTRLSNLLYCGTGYAVDTVFANGRMTVQGGIFLNVNADRILAKCEELLDRLDKKVAML